MAINTKASHYVLGSSEENNNTKQDFEEEKTKFKEIVRTKLDRTKTIGTNLQITNIGNFKLQNWNNDSNKRVKHEVNNPVQEELSRINIEKDNIFNFNQKLKFIEDNRMNIQYDPGISYQDELDLVKNAQSTKYIETIYHLKNANFGIKVELKVYEMFNST
ncbi:7605_t:CDS:2 [Gigaspora rosea]|nr:7605_t:CDS:2 [Gigaspora rosea]